MNKWIFIVIAGVFVACQKGEIKDDTFVLDYPQGFPTMDIPSDNQLTKSRVNLGKKLFYETRLSEDSTVSCASCHVQQLGFAENKVLSAGVHGNTGFRNTPTLTNIGYAELFFMDGGVPTLELQVLAPISNPDEMNLEIPDAVNRMKAIPEYQKMAQEAYGRDFDAFVLTRAIAAYERTLISGNSPYDQHFLQGKNVLNASELNGYQLFVDKGCVNCHSGFNFTDNDFHNVGLYLNYTDIGRKRVTTLDADEGKFKTPTLRNVELTAPYMHDGSLATLEDVVEFLNTGGEAHPNKSTFIQPMNLTSQEKTDLVNFLRSL
ncbi:MAG: c-type cytochrome, partial [Crocinitomicaceae bacterium]|nr:c-type cytochrome [Crocinitomicaceae bacterium]